MVQETITNSDVRLLDETVRVAAVEPLPGELVQGLRSLDEGFIPEILDPSLIDAKYLVSNRDAIAALREIPEVLECHAPAGDTDLVIRVVATSPEDLYRVSEEIRLCPGIVRTSTSMFLREVIPYRTTGLLKE